MWGDPVSFLGVVPTGSVAWTLVLVAANSFIELRCFADGNIYSPPHIAVRLEDRLKVPLLDFSYSCFAQESSSTPFVPGLFSFTQVQVHSVFDLVSS